MRAIEVSFWLRDRSFKFESEDIPFILWVNQTILDSPSLILYGKDYDTLEIPTFGLENCNLSSW